MLGVEVKKIYLNISEGKIVQRTDDKVRKFDFVEGYLKDITAKEREFKGEKVLYYYLDLQDKDTREGYSLGLRATSGVWRSLILSLGSDNFNPSLPIKITPYKRGEYDRVSVYSGGERLDWVSDLPPVEIVKVGRKEVKSTEKRDIYLDSLVEKIKGNLDSLYRG